MERLQTHIVIYINAELSSFLIKKAESGYKISSYVRFLIQKEIEKEKVDKNDA
jgi:hypothetical protein